MTRFSDWVLALAFALAVACAITGYLFGRADWHRSHDVEVNSVEQDIDSLKDLARQLQHVSKRSVGL